METSIAYTDAGPVSVTVLYRRGKIIVHRSLAFKNQYMVTQEPTCLAITDEFLTQGGAKRFADFVSRTAVANLIDPQSAKDLPRAVRSAVKRKARTIHQREMAIWHDR
jgi:hypothetical protein